VNPERRDFFRIMGAGAAGLTLGGASLTSCAPPAPKEEEEDGQVLLIGDNVAVAETSYGKVKGYQLRGIYTFLGMPYGADTSGANRFRPPQKPKPWTDVFPAVWWGNSAPQNMERRYANAYASFADHWNYDDVSEDCLRINVWTPGYGDGKKRPVMVWLHGGGFTSGNGIEQDGYNGENLARYGDIVFCSLNHRLGPIGFTDLEGVDKNFAGSGNAGILDIVAALEWVRDNISNFGGDPGNVTIMGQSGGGAKVCTVVAMPASEGLVHKGVALSGNITGAVPKAFSEKLGAYILEEAGLTARQIDRLQQIPWREYIALANRASEKLIKETGGSGMMRGSFGPVGDGIQVPTGTFYSGPSSHSAGIPLILSTTFEEQAPSRIDRSLESITLDGVKDRLKQRFGDKTAAIVDAYAAAFPDRKPVEIWSLVTGNRQLVIATANAKVKQPAPVYLAWFGWHPPLFDNRMRAFHCLDICFWYYNTDVMLTHTGGGARPRRLSKTMADALLRFMRTGDPNGGDLPHWPAYTEANGETMILNDVCEVKNDPDREARKTLGTA
jgi:para-nitrobenzyl esterase